MMRFDSPSSFMSGILLALVVAAVTKLLHLVWKRKKWTARFKDFPQNPTIPVFGNLLEYPGPNDAGLAFEREQNRKFPKLLLFWLCHVPMVAVSHPDTVKIVLKSSEPKGPVYKLVYPWLGSGLLYSHGNKWARNRRLLTPAFHFDILKGYLSLKNVLCDDLLSNFEKAANSGNTLKVFENISLFTLDVILQSAMSYETKCQKDGGNHPYIAAVNRLVWRIIERFLQPWLYSDWLYFMTPAGRAFKRDCQLVHDVADEVIRKRRAELDSEPSDKGNSADRKRKHQDFLDTLIMARDTDANGLTDQEIRDEVDTFLFEGHDTTASAISWSLYSIAEHPDVQSRIQAELDSLFALRETDYLLWEDLGRLPYLTMVIKESMRLHPPVPYIYRELTRDTDFEGHTVPAGTVVCVSLYRTHHNELLWPDSMKFDPERFSPQNCEKRDPFAFDPFSAGPRNCIGQNFAMDEIKVALARILYRYTIKLDPHHEVARSQGIVMKAKNDIKIYVKPRMSSQ